MSDEGTWRDPIEQAKLDKFHGKIVNPAMDYSRHAAAYYPDPTTQQYCQQTFTFPSSTASPVSPSVDLFSALTGLYYLAILFACVSQFGWWVGIPSAIVVVWLIKFAFKVVLNLTFRLVAFVFSWKGLLAIILCFLALYVTGQYIVQDSADQHSRTATSSATNSATSKANTLSLYSKLRSNWQTRRTTRCDPHGQGSAHNPADCDTTKATTEHANTASPRWSAISARQRYAYEH
jgi:hypothetical protein